MIDERWVYFVLTFPGRIRELPLCEQYRFAAIAMRNFARFLEAKRHHVIWGVEPHGDGAPHYNVVTNGYIHYELIKQRWFSLSGGGMIHEPPEEAWAPAGLGCYFAKDFGWEYPPHVRRYGYSRSLRLNLRHVPLSEGA